MTDVQAELNDNFLRFGCYHTALGRNLHGRSTNNQHTAAAPWLEEKVRQPTITREPIRHIIEGARAYNSARGLGDPHPSDVDYSGIRTTADRIHHLARSYDRLPMKDPSAVPAFESMRRQVNDQFHHLTQRMGVKAEFVDHDPYKNSGEMAHDLQHNKRIQVLGTAQTGSHPFFSDEENNRFRAVHDAFGHAGTGRDFDKHGEEAAFHAHARMFSPDAHGALASETTGQNGHLIYHGSFGPQKVALMHSSLWTPQKHLSVNMHDFRTEQDAQRRRYERSGVAGGTEEDSAYFGTGEHRGDGQERRLNLADFMHDNRAETIADADPHFQAEWAGHEMGYRHGRSGRVDQGELSTAHARSPHPDHFIEGYHEGLSSGFGETMNPQPRVAQLLDDDRRPVLDLDNRPFLVPVPAPTLQRTAHVSGNQIDVLHCFAGEERFLTPDGPKSFAETVGTTQRVLTSSHIVGGVHDGEWVQAPIQLYGEQEVWDLTLTRNKRIKVVRTTAGHRWFVGRPGQYRMVTTEHLNSGHRLAHLRPVKIDVEPSRDGIRAGVFFGDGSVALRDYGHGTYGHITLWDEKAKDLGEFFSEVCPSEPTLASRDNGLTGLRFTSGMVGCSKGLPLLNATAAHLRGWLMGYIATDGDVDRSGKVSLSSAVIENLEHVRNVATLLGVGTYGVVTKMRSGFGAAPSAIHTVAFAGMDLDTSWLLRQRHRDAFSAVAHGTDRFGWTVVSAQSTGEMAEVYCAEVPGTESFVLEDNIHTGNCPFCGSGAIVARSDGSVNCTFCDAAFTVTVSPVYPAFPMSMGGQPYPWPGRPGDDTGMPMDPSMDPSAGGGGFGGSLIPGGGADGAAPGDDDGGNPFADGGDDDGDQGAAAPGGDDEDDTEAEVGGSKKPPWLKKKKSSRRTYATLNGGRVGEQDYLRHLAITTAADPNAMAARIREERHA